MCHPFVLLATCAVLISDVQLVSGGELHSVIYHHVPVIQEKIIGHVPIVSKSTFVPSVTSYTNVIQASYAKALPFTETDVANGYASQILSSNVAFTIPEHNIEDYAPKKTTVQSIPLLSYAVNVKPIVSGYTTFAKSVPVTFDYPVDYAPRFSRILTGPQVDNTYNLNVLSESEEVSPEIVKKAPLYTEAIFKPWPSLKK